MLTRWLEIKSIFFIKRRIYHYQFKSSYLRNQMIFAMFLLNLWNVTKKWGTQLYHFPNFSLRKRGYLNGWEVLFVKKPFLSSHPIHIRRKALSSYFFFILSPIEWEKPFFLTSMTLKQLGNTLSASKYRKCILLFYFYP